MIEGVESLVRRYRLLVAYDGSAYHGFQLQRPGLDTVAGRLESALGRICPEGSEGDGRVTVVGASRTDAGVHARGQVCAFSSRTTVPVERLPLALGSLLPRDIVVLEARPAPPDFDPRRDALSKIYCYRIWQSRLPSPFWRNWALHAPVPLDLEACREALRPLTGRHDFAAFRDAGSSAMTTVRTVESVSLEARPLPAGHPAGGEFISLWIRGGGFLYHMVRIVVGTLLEVGLGRLPPEAVARALASGRREELGPTAPPQGLWLEKVFYEGDETIGGGRATASPSGGFGPQDLETSELAGFYFP